MITYPTDKLQKVLIGGKCLQGVLYGEPTTVSAKPTEVVRTQATEYAPVKSMKGNTVKWNQLCSKSYAEKGSNTQTPVLYDTYFETRAIDDSTAGMRYAGFNNFMLENGHKYYVSIGLKRVDGSGLLRMYIAYNQTTQITNYSNDNAALGTWYSKKVIFDSTSSYNGTYRVVFDNTNGTIHFRYPTVIDLTAIFGAGNEPATVEAFESWLSTNIGLKDYYPYDAGSLLSVNTPSTVINGEEYPFPITTLTDINGTVMFPNGLCQAGSIKDEIDWANGIAVKRVGSVDLGGLSWEKSYVYSHDDVNIFVVRNFETGNVAVCSKYQYYNAISDLQSQNKSIRVNRDNRNIIVHDNSYSDPIAFQQVMSGVMLYYELATPIEYTLSVKGIVPTPDAPIDIWCNNGALKVSKNLFDSSTIVTELGSISAGGSFLDSTTRIRSKYIPVMPDTTYTISLSNSNIQIVPYYYDANKVFISYGDGWKNTPYSLTTPVDCRYLCILYKDKTTESPSLSSISNVQLEQGSTATPYMPYGQIYTDGTVEQVTDNLGNTANAERLLEVGDYKDTQSVLDGKVTRNVGIKVLDGTENWVQSSTANLYSLDGLSNYDSISFQNVIPYCTHFTAVLPSTSGVNMPDYVVRCGGGSISTDVVRRSLYIKNVDISTLSDFTQYLADQYAAGTPVIIVYPIATPTTEQVTPQPLAGNTATVTAGSIDNLPIESSTIAELKKRYIGVDILNGASSIQGSVTINDSELIPNNDYNWVRDTNGNPIFPDGMKKAGSVYDEITIVDGVLKAIKRVGSVDLGTLKSWNISYDVYCSVRINRKTNGTRSNYGICSKYPVHNIISYDSDFPVDSISVGFNDNTVRFKSSVSETSTSIQNKMQGVILYYELATPIEYEVDNAREVKKVYIGDNLVWENNDS